VSNKLLKKEMMQKEKRMSGMLKILELKMKLQNKKHKGIKREMMSYSNKTKSKSKTNAC
jgi:hypothetical protein